MIHVIHMSQILSIAYLEKMASNISWMKGGMSKKPKYIPIYDVVEKLSGTLQFLETLIPLHALTGYDTVSSFWGQKEGMETVHQRLFPVASS